MLPVDYQITTQMLYQGALLFGLLDALIIPVLVWRVNKNRFQQVKWALVAIAGIFWFGIWRWATINYWETVYQYVFPDWQDL
jgi:hypothetical protein